MSETVTISRAEYERLCALEDDFEDLHAISAIEERIAAGTDELVPARVADRLIDGGSPLRVWREHRGFSQSTLARASGVNRVQIVEIESGRNTGSVRTLRRLADALGISVDDLVPV